MTHIHTIFQTDMTTGYHCGYISPIPDMVFNEKLGEEDFKILMKAVSNDIVSWESVKEKMKDGGITYGEESIIVQGTPKEVPAVNGMKFISGANLGMNLKNSNKIYPFYNPPGARGEDTFLSTCICGNEVVRIPVYTFHDGFSAYGGLLAGALPNSLKTMTSGSPVITKRFYRALVGWIRYKPSRFTSRRMTSMKPGWRRWNLQEFSFYRSHVMEHHEEFMTAKRAWIKMMKAW